MDPRKIPSILTDSSILNTYEKVFKGLQNAIKDIANKDEKKKKEAQAKELSACATTLFGTVADAMKGIRPDGAALLGKFKPNAYEEAEERIANLKRSFPGGDKWPTNGRPNGKKIADASRALREMVKDKTLELPKSVDGSVRELVSLLEKLGTEGRNWFEDAADDMAARLGELGKEAERLKALADNQDGGSSGDLRDKRASKTRNALKELRTAPPDRTVPMIVLVKGSELFVYVSRDATSSQVPTLKNEIFDGTADKPHIGSVAYRDKRYMFVSSTLSGGSWTQRIQKALQNDIGQRLPISVSNDKGLLDPPLTGDDFADPIDFLISERPVLKDRAKRLKTLRTDLIKEAEKSGALGREGRDGTYLAVHTRILEKFDELVSDDPPKLDEAEKVLRRIQTEVITPFLARRASAKSDQAEFEKEQKDILPWAKGLERESALLFSQIGAIYGKARDKAPKEHPEVKDVLRTVATLLPKCDAASVAASKAQNGGDYDGEWDKAKAILYQIDEQRSRWEDLKAQLLKEAREAVETLKKQESKA